MKQIVIGLTGGTGCGKTTALHALEDLGFHIIDCDSLYHELLRTDTAMVRAIGGAFPGVLGEDGMLQRKVLGRQVFADPEADAFFPDLDADPAWEIAEVEPPLEHEGLSFRYVTYRRVP